MAGTDIFDKKKGFDIICRTPFMVEVTGLEPMASWSRTKRATNCATPRNVCAFQLPIHYIGKRKILQPINEKSSNFLTQSPF